MTQVSVNNTLFNANTLYNCTLSGCATKDIPPELLDRLLHLEARHSGIFVKLQKSFKKTGTSLDELRSFFQHLLGRQIPCGSVEELLWELKDETDIMNVQVSSEAHFTINLMI